MSAKRNLAHQSSWAIRRRFMFAVVGFCMLTVGYCLFRNLDTRVAEAAVTFAFITIAAIVGSYVFGAAWEDISKVRLEPQPYTGGMYGAPPIGADLTAEHRPPGHMGE